MCTCLWEKKPSYNRSHIQVLYTTAVSMTRSETS